MIESGASSPPLLNDPVGLEKEEPLHLKRISLLGGTVWGRIDRRILPLLSVFLLLSTLDWTNIANARVAGLQPSLAMSNYQFTLALTVTSLCIVISEFPFTLFLKYVGPDYVLPAMVMLWGVVSAVQGLVNNYTGLIVCRVFLGLLDGGLYPSVILYLSFFYPPHKLQIRMATLFTVATLSGAFSGLLAAAIDHMDGVGGRPGWAWIFILEGLFTVIFGAVSFVFIPRSPEKARFLSVKERAHVISVLRSTGAVSDDIHKDRFNWAEVIQVFKDPQVWLLAVVLFFNGAIVTGLSYFEPTIVAGIGYEGNQAQLMSVPPYVVTFVLSLISGAVSDRYRCRGLTTIFFSLLVMIGFTMFYVSTSSHVRYASLFLSVSGGIGATPAISTWVTNNSAPHGRRAAAVATSFAMFPCGGLLATWLFGWISPAPDYTLATLVFIGISAGMVVFSAANLVYLRWQNRVKAERRQRMTREDEPEGLGDRSAWFIYSL